MNEPLEHLRERMAERGIDACLVPACDDHQSEYFSDYFNTTRFLSHFTGESCTLVITAEEALLWTDGRFFLQAQEQMEESFTLCRMGEDGVPTVEEYLAQNLPDGGCLGFDGRLIPESKREELQQLLSGRGIRFAWEEDLIDLVWPDRPALTSRPGFLLEQSYAGRSREEKLRDLREDMRGAGADTHILSTLDDICWLFNIRGGDVAYTPVILSYAIVTLTDAALFLMDGVADRAMTDALNEAGVTLRAYEDIGDAIAALPASSRVLYDPNLLNMTLAGRIPADCERICAPNPTTQRKAVKNEIEIQNMKNCHVRDGVALVRFLYWLKTHIGKEEITELSATRVLEDLRAGQDLSMGPSFETIAGYGPHGAVIHYAATPETNAVLAPEGFLLLDSGGQYRDGTTDVTRTIVLGPLTDEQKMYFTLTACSMLDLASAEFPEGCTGQNLDILTRRPFWNRGLDYRHGTGHGIGFLLSCHEGPQSFRWKLREKDRPVPFEPGMITSDEPGFYLDHQYGIRLENELLCVEKEETEYGRFLGFETLTLCPIDRDAIDPQYMTKEELRLLNEYHRKVWETLHSLLPAPEAAWLREATRPI